MPSQKVFWGPESMGDDAGGFTSDNHFAPQSPRQKNRKAPKPCKIKGSSPFLLLLCKLCRNIYIHTRRRTHTRTRARTHTHTRYRGLRSDFGRKVQKTARISLILNEKLALHSRKRTANPFAKKSPLAVKRAGWWSGMAVVVRLPKVAVYTRG